MNAFPWIVLLAASVASVAQGPGRPAESTKPAEGHADHSTPAPASGLKQELIEGITEADFLRLGDRPRTVEVTIVAVWTDDNHGMNFNGYSKGGAVYTIPKDWTVEVNYINPSPIPHSLIVIEKASVKKIQVPEPYFEGAAVPKHLQGISYGKSHFTFKAEEAGEFAFACGFPTHALNGHWIGLEISTDAKVPTLKLGNQPAREATR